MTTVQAITVLSQWRDKRSSSREISEISEKTTSNQNSKRTILLNKLSEVFIPSLFGSFFGSGLVEKDTLLGRITVTLSQRNSVQGKKETLAKIFKDAVELLKKSNETVPLDLVPVIAEIDFALNSTDGTDSPIPLPENEGLNTLKETYEEKKAEAQKRIYEASLLRAASSSSSASPSETAPKISETFLSIFRGKATSDALTYLYGFLQNESENQPFLKPVEQVAEKQSLIQKGSAFIANATKRFLDASDTDSSEVLNSITQECLVEIGKLEPGSKWLLCGGYGQRIESLETAFKILKALPKEQRDLLPHPFPSILEQDKLPNPEEFAQKAIHEALTEIHNLFPGMQKILGFSGINAFFKDDERSLPKALSHILPVMFEKLQKEGILQQLSLLIPNKGHSDLVAWIGANRNVLLGSDSAVRESTRADFEKKLAKEFRKPSNDLMKSLDAWLFSTIDSLQKDMPSEMLEFLHLDSLLVSGAMWIEFERQVDGKMAVIVHASGNAMAKHPLFNNMDIEWPLRLSDIDPTKINKDFIQQLLYHTLVPLRNCDAVSKAENIYAGPLKHLEGKASVAPKKYSKSIDVNNLKNVLNTVASTVAQNENVPEKAKEAAEAIAPNGVKAETLPVGVRLHNELDVVVASLLQPTAPLPLVQFKLKLKVFLDYTQGFLTGPNKTLVIKDSLVAANLEMGIKALIAEAAKIETLLGNSDIANRLSATMEEVNQAIDIFRTEEERNNLIETDHALQIPKKILDSIVNFMKQNNISTDAIKKAKGVLCWALGEDAEEIIDSLTDAIENSLSKSNRVGEEQLEKGWLKTILSSAYTHAAANILLLAWGVGKFSVGQTPTALFLYFGNWGLEMILPNPLYNWYKIALNSVMMELARTAFYIILRIFLFSSEEIEQIQSVIRQTKHIVKVYAKALNSSQKLEFIYDPKIKDKGEVKLKLSKTPVKLVSAEISFNGISVQSIPTQRLTFPAFPTGSDCVDNFLPLIHFAESLTIPTIGAKDEWDTIENPEVVLDKLSTLATDIYNNINSFSSSPDITSRAILAMYSTLTITEKLAKRCNDSLQDKSINAYPFLAFLKGHGNLLKAPYLHIRARQICSYLMPKVDLDNLSDNPLSEPAIESAKRESFFDYSKAHDYYYILNSDHLPEARFLNSLLQNNDVKKRLKKAGIDPKKTSKRKQLGILLEETFSFNRGDEPIVPKSFCHLKLHTVLANRLVTFLGTEGDKNQFVKADVKEAPPKNYNLNNDDQAFYKRPFSGITNRLDKPTDHPLISKTVPSINNCFYTDRTTWSAFVKGQPTQAEIIAAENGRIQVPTANHALKAEISKNLDKVFVEKDDIILRSIDFLSKYLPQVNDNNQTLMQIFDGVFLGFGNLEKQLKTAPQVTKTLAHFFSQKIPMLMANKQYHHCLWLISLGFRVKALVESITGTEASGFPNFNEYIHQIIQAERNACLPSNCYSQILGYAMQMKALSHPLPHSISPEQKKVAAQDFARAFFFQTNRESDQTAYTLSNEFRERYRHWLPILKEMCANSEERSELCTLLLKDRHNGITPFEVDSTVTFVNGDFLNFTLSHRNLEPFSFNFKTAYIDGPLKYALGTYFRIREKVIEIDPKERDLLVGESISTVGGLTIEYTKTDDSISIQKEINIQPLIETTYGPGVRKFTYISSPEYSKHLLPFVKGDTSKLASAKFWLENTNDPIRYVYVEIENSSPLLLEVKSTNEGFSLIAIHQDKKAYSVVPNRQFAHLLLPINRFCPSEKTYCFTSKVKNKLSKIFLEPFSLSFNIVEDDKGRLFAESTEHQGFRLASQQIHKSLFGMPSYLLLKNNNNDAKVLLPDNQWLSSALTTAIPKMGVHGSFARILERWFGNIQQNKAPEKQKLYSFDIKEGLLVSEDPEAMMYLISLYLLQKKGPLAEETCKEMIRILKQKKEKVDISQLMFMFSLVPGSNTEVSRMRRHIVAALEENNALNATLEDNKAKPAQDAQLKDHRVMSRSVMELKACKEDLEANYNEKEQRYKLTDDQELRLFNRFNTLAQELIKTSLGLPKNIVAFLETLGWEATSNVFLLPQHLSTRYDTLTSKLDKTKQRKTKVKNLIAEYARTSSSYSSYNLVETTSLWGILGKIGLSGLNTAKEILVDTKIGIRNLDIKQLAKDINSPAANQEVNPPLDNIDAFFENLVPLFSSYYTIAFGQGSEEQSQKLKNILQIAKGGRSPTTDKLVEYLTFVQSSILAAAKPAELNKILALEDPKKKVEELEAFFNSLNSSSIYHSRTTSLFRTLGGASLDKVYAAFLTPLAIGATYNTAFNYVMHGLSKGVNMAWNALPSFDSNPHYTDPSYANFNDADAYIDGALSQAFDIGFNVIKDGTPLPQIAPFSEGDDKINESLKKYYEERGKNPIERFECKGVKALCDMQLALGSLHSILKNKCDTELNALLEIVNFKRSQDKLTLQSLKKALLLDQWAKLGVEIGFTQAEMAQIELAIASYMVMSTRTAQIGRILENFKKLSLSDIKENPMDFIEALQTIAVETKAKRAYSFAEVPKRIALRYMIFELYTNTMIWDLQANPLTNMLQKNGNIFLVMLMSLGKTFQMIPINDSKLADGENVVFNVFTDGLQETNIRQISKQGPIFDQHANRMTVSRASMQNIKQLEAVNIMMSRVQTNRETINIVPSEAQSLDANLMDLLYYAKRSGKNDLTLFIAQVQHKVALMKMRTHGVAIQDEAHIQYDHKEGELNHPIGEVKSVDEAYQNVMEECMRQIVANNQVLEKIRTNSLEDLSKEDFAIIAEEIALELCANPQFKLKNDYERNIFVKYVTGKTKIIPKTLRDKDSYENIALVKGVLSILMPALLKLNIHVDYDLFGNSASPCSGNMQRHVGYSIQISFEKAIKTYVSLLKKGLSDVQAKDLYAHMFKDARAEMLSRSRPFTGTLVYKKLCIILKDNAELLGNIRSENSREIEEELTSILKNNPEAILHYVRAFGYTDIKDWERCNRVNNQNFPSLWKRLILDTGTPYNIESCPDDLDIIDDEKTLGEAMHLISTNCVEEPVVVDAKDPKDILKNILDSSFKTNEYSMMTDGNAVLKGLSTTFVADAMDAHCQAHRKDIKAIIYFTELQGKDQLVFREIGSDTPKPFDQCKLKPSEYLVYVDDNHGEGTNVVTKGLNLILFKKQPLYKVSQQAFRKRSLREIFKLILSGNFAELQTLCKENKKIRFAMTTETARRLCPNGEKPNVRTILEDARKTQKESRLLANSITYRKKLHNVIRQLIKDKLIFAKASLLEWGTMANDINKMNEIFADFEDFLMPLVKNKPSELFGKIEVEVETHVVNKKTKEDLYAVIAKSKHFSKKEKAEAQRLLDAVKVPLMPEKLTVFTDGKELDVNTHDLFGAQTNVQEVMENEMDIQTQQQANTAVKTISKTPKRFVETEWPASYNYSNLDWLTFHSGAILSNTQKVLNWGSSLLGTFKSKIEFPALFKFQESLSFASNPAIKDLSQEINSKLWFTNNYIPRILTNFFGEPVEVCGNDQRDLFQVLVIIENGTVSSVGSLSQHEATTWKGHVNKIQSDLKSNNKRMYVYDIPTRTIRAGGDEKDQQNLLKDKEFLQLEVQLKFLNGDDTYTPHQILLLKEWLSGKDLDATEKAYYAIHAQRQNTSASRSDIEFVFQDLRELAAIPVAQVM